MNRYAKGLGLLVLGTIGLTLLGQGGIAGLLLLPACLVALIAFIVRGARPAYVSGGRQRARAARSFNYLARYRKIDDVDGVLAMVLAGSGLWSFLTAAGAGTDRSSMVLVGICGALAYGFITKWAALVISTMGTLGVCVAVFTELGCSEPVGPSGRVAFLVMAAACAAGFAVSRLGFLSPGSLLGGRQSLGGMALVFYGLLDLSGTVVRPGGLDVWGGGPAYWLAGLGGAVIVFALAWLAGNAPELVLGLVALVGLVLNYAISVAGEVGTVSQCPSPYLEAAFVVVFVVATMIVMASRAR